MTAALILAGGQSRRMGENKALLKVGGIPLIERVARILRPLISELAVVTRPGDDYSFLDLPVIHDRVPDQGVLTGLATGLEHIQARRALAVACDMPFIQPTLVKFMLSIARDADIVAPLIGDFHEPLFSIYSKACIAPAWKIVERGEQSILELYHHVPARFVSEAECRVHDPELQTFINLNSKLDLDKLAKNVESCADDCMG